MEKDKSIVIIPARGGSKRLPNKNILSFGELPLIAHSILYAKRHNFIDKIYVTTDNKDIKECAIKFGAEVIDRPENISGDFEPTVSAIKHVLETIRFYTGNVILLQPTNPLRPVNLLNEAFNLFLKTTCDSLFTVSKINRKCGKIQNNLFVPINYSYGQRSQDMDSIYFENGLLYISKTSVIFKDEIITKDAIPFEVNHVYANIDIDTQEDLDYAEYILNTHKDIR